MAASVAGNNCLLELVLLFELTIGLGVGEKKPSLIVVSGANVSGGRDRHHSPTEVRKK